MAEKIQTSEAFLEEVAEQISYRPLRPVIVSELQDHIDDRIGEYQNEGCSREQAEQKAVTAMGDPVVIGTEINAVRHVQTNPVLAVLTAALMFAGLAAAVYMNWTPEQYDNGFGYYLPGLVVLLAASFYSYPLLVKYWKRILLFLLVLFIAGILSCIYRRTSLLDFLHDLEFDLPSHLLNYLSWRGTYYASLILGPLLTVAIYSYRHHSGRLFFFFTAAESWVLLCAANGEQLAGIAVFVVSFSGTILFMVRKKIFASNNCLLFPLLLAVTFIFLPSQRDNFQEFITPQDTVNDVWWADTYNGVLIQELLSRTPTIGALSLTPEELVDYGTGNWYFGIDVKRLYYVYDESTVTLLDILPQHYHNNYLLAVGILMFGRLFGILCLAVIGAFFLTIFRCVFLIRGKLASCMAFNCAMVLLVQTILYIAGNLGYQYEYFTNLPLISEGKISIVINMILLGFIFSAYRYDRVIDEPPVSYRLV